MQACPRPGSVVSTAVLRARGQSRLSQLRDRRLRLAHRVPSRRVGGGRSKRLSARRRDGQYEVQGTIP